MNSWCVCVLWQYACRWTWVSGTLELDTHTYYLRVAHGSEGSAYTCEYIRASCANTHPHGCMLFLCVCVISNIVPQIAMPKCKQINEHTPAYTSTCKELSSCRTIPDKNIAQRLPLPLSPGSGQWRRYIKHDCSGSNSWRTSGLREINGWSEPGGTSWIYAEKAWSSIHSNSKQCAFWQMAVEEGYAKSEPDWTKKARDWIGHSDGNLIAWCTRIHACMHAQMKCFEFPVRSIHYSVHNHSLLHIGSHSIICCYLAL